jgi:hypothetical protein
VEVNTMLCAATPRRRMLCLIVASMATLLVLALVAGCSTGGSTSMSAPPTATASATATIAAIGSLPPTVTGTLGPPPSNCHIALPPHEMTVTNFGGGFIGAATFAGAPPAWELGLGNDGTITMTGSPYPSTKIMWVVGPNYAQPVTLSGRELATGTPFWFDVYPNNLSGGRDTYGTSAVLDPTAPNRGSTDNSSGHWNIWGIGIIATAAGCYQLDVASSAGSWHVVLAVGGGS